MTKRARKRRIRKFAPVLVVAALIGAAAISWRWVQGMLANEPIPTAEVTSERFVRRVRAEGNLRAVVSTPLLAPVEARSQLKIAWLVEEGTEVEEGDIVARFDPTEKQRELADGQAAHEAASHKMGSEQVMSATAIRNRDRAADMAAREREQTREFQAVDPLIFSRNQIVESEIDEGLATASEQHARAVKGIERGVSRSKLAQLEIERRAAALKVADAERVLAGMELRAPHAGVVVLRRNWRGTPLRVGDPVWSGQALAEIPLVDEMEAEVFVLEADAGGLEEGKPATVIVESQPDERYEATIKRVDSLARPRHAEVPVQYFGVTLSLARTDSAVMKPGQRVRVELLLDDRDAVVIPRGAVFEADGNKIIYRLAGGAFEPVPVELGPATPGRVVIESGLTPGDRVALRDPTATGGEGADGGAEQRASSPSGSGGAGATGSTKSGGRRR